MASPPGLRYVLRLIPYFAIPSVAVYGSLWLLQEYKLHPALIFPSWFIILCAIFARPALFLVQFKYYTPWVDKRAAAQHGAILAPHISESAFTIIPQMIESTRIGYPSDIVLGWSKKYGNTYQFSLFTSSNLVTLEPDHVKAILATQFESFEKGPTFISMMGSLLGTGVFNADGEMWKFHRAMTRPFFTRERISDFDIYDRNCDLSLRHAKDRLAEGYSVDFQDLVSRFTMDSATEFLFGHNVSSLSAGIPYPPGKENPESFKNHPSTEFVNSFMEGQILSVERIGLGSDWPLAEFLKDKVAPMRHIIDRFVGPVLAQAQGEKLSELSDKGGLSSEEDTTLLAHLLRHTQDPKILKDELANLLVAGRDTTMSLLTFSFYMLSQHPEIEKRLRQEVFDKVGPSDRPTYDQMRDMKFMRAFLNEVLRLYPPVPGDLRTTNKPVVFPSVAGQPPIYVPANTSCLYSVFLIHRRTDLWGPDALKFDPDRFLDERLHKYLTPNPFIFCPFNAGPRICLGQQFAYHEATFFLVRLLQNFRGFNLDSSVNVPPPAAWAQSDGRKAFERVHPLSHLTMYINGGLWIT
ncbi:cytochrome P450 monooxygenase pc-3 [Gymnopilus junonius]|uniref:Cytochrome P450 monooxygenase pc-3 n=1 Tax=Gymnopilus junonius TaxID=109634 RepID=A0A9P5NW28_GYMJU|nr:cytochrome P450 monooxygenase pc-3 [Gymnopilus junonius]